MKFKSVLTCAAAIVTAVPAVVMARANMPVDDLLDRASTYVEQFVREFSTVVAEERYVQDLHPVADIDLLTGSRAQTTPQHVELHSDFLFVSADTVSPWLTFRDVYSVNGRAVRDREERLTRLFVNPRPDAVDRAGQISREGYRYNVGSPDRTVANPLVALGFLQSEYRARFEYRVTGIDTSLGPDVWTVKFKERVRPTILRTPDNRNVVAMGRFWIDGASGRVLQTELETSTGDRVMTTFAYDERLQMGVPAEMRDIAWSNRSPVTGIATYSNFRRFGVATNEKFR
ncbi:MAG TPA: hypothetical protein VLV86_01835 [Vicinamibacterales bacterium]|nr:hypothetical protein [Vicinamibacterales bacterium]